MTLVVLSDREEDRGGARGEEDSSDSSSSDSAAAGVMTVVVMLRRDGGDCDEDHYGRDLHLLSPCYVPSSMLNTEHSLSHLISCNM